MLMKNKNLYHSFYVCIIIIIILILTSQLIFKANKLLNFCAVSLREHTHSISHTVGKYILKAVKRNKLQFMWFLLLLLKTVNGYYYSIHNICEPSCSEMLQTPADN